MDVLKFEALPDLLCHGVLGREIVSWIPGPRLPLDWEDAVYQDPDVAFYLAIQFNNGKQVDRILQAIKYGNVSIQKRDLDKGFVAAAKFNRPVITRTLLGARDGTGNFLLDPAADCNYAIQLASQKGHARVVQLLLEARNGDGSWRVDPAADYNCAIRMAANGKHGGTTLLLLKAQNDDGSWRVTLPARRTATLERAVARGTKKLALRLVRKEVGIWEMVRSPLWVS